MPTTGRIAKELATAVGVSEQDAAKVLSQLGLDDRTADVLRNVSAKGFEQVKLGDLRISAKLGPVVVAR